MGIEIEGDSLNVLKKNLGIFDDKVRAGLHLISKQVCAKMESWAKENAPWTDRTTSARRGLKASAEWEDYIELVIQMSHTVPYGVWLELAHERKYAILERAIERYKDEFIEQWIKILNNIKV